MKVKRLQEVNKSHIAYSDKDAAHTIQDVRVPGYDLHPLKGKLKGMWSVRVSGNYRIIFAFIESKAGVIDVDYLDYH